MKCECERNNDTSNGVTKGCKEKRKKGDGGVKRKQEKRREQEKEGRGERTNARKNAKKSELKPKTGRARKETDTQN